MPLPSFHIAGPEDADRVARLHADSWRRNYRGYYTDAYLDGVVLDDRISTWRTRFAARAGTWTLLAEEDDGPLAGFVHVEFDADEQWGSLVENLHVVHGRQRSGIGRALLGRAAGAVLEQAAAKSMYLWVLEQNTRGREFYRACGGAFVERTAIPTPSVPGRLVGSPHKLRVAWPDPSALSAAPSR